MKKVFDEDVKVYLYGPEKVPALTDGKLEKKSGLYTKFLIGHHPDIMVYDRRGLDWKDVYGFNVKSRAKIFFDKKTEKLRITLLKPAAPRRKPKKTLLFGVEFHKTFPAYDMELEVFKPSTRNKKYYSFVTIINQ